MLGSAIRFVRLPWLLILIWAVARFSLGIAGVPYAPRGNAMFSIVGLTFISCLYFGALSRTVGGFDWKGTVLVGIAIGLFGQVLIFLATLVSYAGGLDTYFVHWDALNIPEGTTLPMAKAMATRTGGLLVGGLIVPPIIALIGRALSRLAPGRTSS
jgi:hypothetical protein